MTERILNNFPFLKMKDKERKKCIKELHETLRKNRVLSIVGNENSYITTTYPKVIWAALPYLNDRDRKILASISFQKNDPKLRINTYWGIKDKLLAKCSKCSTLFPIATEICPLCGEEYYD